MKKKLERSLICLLAVTMVLTLIMFQQGESKQAQAAEKPMRFVVFSDSQGKDNGVSSDILRKTMENLKTLKQQPGFFVIPGDLVDGASSYDAIKSQLQYMKDIVTEYYPESSFYRGIGNHEVVAGVNGKKASAEVFQEAGATYMEGSNKAVYYFDKGSARFWMLDTDHKDLVGNVSEKVTAWIKKNNSKTAKRNFFFVHEAQFPSGMTAILVDRLKRAKLWQQIDAMKSPMVFSGHEHYYTRRHIDAAFNEKVNGTLYKFNKSIYQLTVGGMNPKFYDDFSSTLNVDVKPKKVNHYVVVDVYSRKVSVTVYSIDRKVIDSFAIK